MQQLMNRSLEGKVTIVTGASRGGGRGIALVLGEAGATVYVTGRSVRGQMTHPHLASTTIDETAEMVTARGGVGIPVRVDHAVDAEVEALFERVKQEQGGLDIMVNNAWGGYQNNNLRRAPFWEQEMFRWDNMYLVGVRSHLLGSRLAAQMMVPRRQGLIVNTTVIMEDEYPGDGCMFYYAAKHATNRMASAMAADLRRHNIPLIGLAPGWMRGEASMPGPKDFHKTESPEYSGRAVLALATDPNVMARSGRVYETADLGRDYGFVDIDGRQLPPFRVRNTWR